MIPQGLPNKAPVLRRTVKDSCWFLLHTQALGETAHRSWNISSNFSPFEFCHFSVLPFFSNSDFTQMATSMWGLATITNFLPSLLLHSLSLFLYFFLLHSYNYLTDHIVYFFNLLIASALTVIKVPWKQWFLLLSCLLPYH